MSANFPSRQANININFWVVGERSTLWFFGPEFSIDDPKTLSFYHSMFSCNSIPRYVFRSPGICFWGTKYDVYCLRVGYLYSILWRRARLWLELFASTVGGFLSRVSYLPSYVFLRRRHGFTLRKLYASSREILMFLAVIWSSLCSWSSIFRFIPLLIALVPQDSNIALYEQVCWLCCVLYMPLFGLVQAKPWFRSSMRISSVAGISKYFVRLKSLAQLVHKLLVACTLVTDRKCPVSFGRNSQPTV